MIALPTAATQTQKFHTLSDKYSFVSTKEIIDQMSKMGWQPIATSTKAVRNSNVARLGYQGHTVVFGNPSLRPVQKKLGGLEPRFLFLNSHDGTSRVAMMLQIYRLVCTNGLTRLDHSIDFTSAHKGIDLRERLLAGVNTIISETPKLFKSLDDYNTIELTPDEQGVFAYRAMVAKHHGKSDVVDAMDIDYAALLAPRRPADQEPTLWNTFNIIQEKLTTPSEFVRNAKGAYQKSRGLKNFSDQIRINKELWSIMDEIRTSRN